MKNSKGQKGYPKTHTNKANVSKVATPAKNVKPAVAPNFPFLAKFLENHYFFLGALGIIYVVMLFIVNPVGEFPLNDDWVYAKPVSLIVNHHPYFIGDMYSAVLIAQAFWGTLFCLLGRGFSFTALRFSTIVLGLAGAVIFYFLVYDFSKNRKISFLAALLLMINPLYFSLSNTFMTDVPFVATTLFSIFFFVKYINAPQLKFLIWATLFSIFAALIRQFGVLIPIAFGVCEIIIQKKSLANRLKYLIPAVLTCIALEIGLKWLKHINSYPENPHSSSILDFPSNPVYWSKEVVKRSQNALFYFGLLFFPLLLFFKIPSFKTVNSFLRVSGIVVLVVIGILFISLYRGFPTVNILNDGYLGPKCLSDVLLYHIPGHDIDSFSGTTMKIIYFIGYVGVILFSMNIGGLLVKAGKYSKLPLPAFSLNAHKKLFIAICSAGYFFLLLAPSDHFDRYLLPLFPLFCLLFFTEVGTAARIRVPAIAFSTIFIVYMIYFSACGTHDYLSWNRVRWQAVDYLTKDQNISIHKIDAGYEVNGWLIGTGKEIDTHKLWGCVDDNTYMLSFSEINGCKTLKQFEYPTYFSQKKHYIYVLQTKNP